MRSTSIVFKPNVGNTFIAVSDKSLKNEYTQMHIYCVCKCTYMTH